MREHPIHPRPAHLVMLADDLDLNYRGVEVEHLALPHVVDECELWLGSSFDWSARWAAQPRVSLANELLVGLANVGGLVRSLCGGVVEGAEAAAAEWRSESKGTATGPRVLQGWLSALTSVLFTSAGLEAMWGDLVDCYEGGLRGWRRRERVLDFVALSEVVGHSAPWFALDLVGLIRDEVVAVGEARRRLDGSDYDVGVVGVAGSPLAEMSDLLARTVSRGPRVGECVVWFEFVNADLGGVNRVDAGTVQYWHASHASELVGDAGVELPSPLDELRIADHRIVILPRAHDIDSHSVWARVDLGRRVAPGATAEAHAVAMLLADLAALRVGGPRWGRGDWSQVLIDGHSVADTDGRGEPDFPPFPGHMRHVGDELERLAGPESKSSQSRAELGRVARLWAEVEEREGSVDRVPAVCGP